MIARNAATETMITATTIIGVKAWCFFAMKRTTGPKIPALRLGFFLVPYDLLPHNLGDRNSITNVV